MLPDLFAGDSLPALQKLELDGYDMRHPPAEVCKKGLPAIRSFFSALRAGGSRHHKLRVMLLGKGEAGKSSLLHGLLKGSPACTHPDDRTKLMEVYSWKPDAIAPVELSLWDSGGQLIYAKLTSRFFIHGRAAFVVVVDISVYSQDPEGEHEELVQCWLNYIQMQVSNALVLIVVTKSDLVEPDVSKAAVHKMVQLIQAAEANSLERLNRKRQQLQEQLAVPQAHLAKTLQQQLQQVELQLEARLLLPEHEDEVTCCILDLF